MATTTQARVGFLPVSRPLPGRCHLLPAHRSCGGLLVQTGSASTTPETPAIRKLAACRKSVVQAEKRISILRLQARKQALGIAGTSGRLRASYRQCHLSGGEKMLGERTSDLAEYNRRKCLSPIYLSGLLVPCRSNWDGRT